jgi:deazaflavin-dependent oxidoreductase (nitroreductase family)
MGFTDGSSSGRPFVATFNVWSKVRAVTHQPLNVSTHGDRWIVFASKAGDPRNPDWYHNLVANPTVTLEAGAETFEAEATVVTWEERDHFCARQAHLFPSFAEYDRKTIRKIPVVALTRKR